MNLYDALDNDMDNFDMLIADLDNPPFDPYSDEFGFDHPDDYLWGWDA